jgi:WD40 repeat protein/serine/threonine protein kinase
MISFACPHCQHRLRVKDELAGKKGKCPHCGHGVLIAPDPPEGRRSAADALTLPPPPAADAATLPPAEASPPQAGSDGTEAEDEAARELIDFLAPAQAPGELGRLGEYRVVKVLGAGGMGVVFQAEDPRLQRQVALKAMLPSLAASASARERFLREARAAAAIEHDHIIAIHQVGEDRGVPFLAMPLLRGEPLDRKLHREGDGRGGLPLAEVLRIGREMAEGLAAAHERGLIHRDIKPANVWLEGERARVKILDFGLARQMQDQSQLTQSGVVIGTPAYMAPEQANGQKTDARSDLFSLGCVLYRLCTGEPPFRGADTISTLVAVATEQPPAPALRNPKLPPALSDLVMRLLAKAPADRPQTAKEVAAALEEIEASRRRSRDEGSTTVVPALPGPPKRDKGLLVVGAAVAALVLLGVAALLVLPRGDRAKRAGENGQEGSALGGTPEPPPPPQPIVDTAFVSEPAPLPGVQSWSIEPRLHRGRLHATAFSHDSRFLVAAGEDQRIRVWEASTGKLVRLLMGHTQPVLCLALSPDTRSFTLASGGSDRTVCIWDGATGRLLHRLGEHKTAVNALAWLDETTLAAKTIAPDHATYLWSTTTGKLLGSVPCPVAGNMGLLRWSPDGKHLATGLKNGGISLWDGRTGKLVRNLDGPKVYARALAWSPDSKVVAVVDRDRKIHLWDAGTGKVRRPSIQTTLKEPPRLLAWAPGGKFVLVGGGEKEPLTSWDVGTGKQLLAVPTGRRLVTLAFSPDGKMVAGADVLCRLIRWSAPTRKFLPGIEAPAQLNYTAILYSPDGKQVAFAHDHLVCLWTLSGPTFRRITSVAQERPRLAWSWQGDRLAVSTPAGPNVEIHEAATGERLQVLTRNGGNILAGAFSPDGKRFATTGVGRGQKLLIHDAATAKVVAASPDGKEVVGAGGLVWSPDGKLLASNGEFSGSGPNKVVLWDAGKRPLVPRFLAGHEGTVRAVSWSPGGTLLASAGKDNTIRIWKRSGQPAGKLFTQGLVSAFRWLSEERLLAVVDDHTATLWDVPGGQPLRSLKLKHRSGSISPNGQTFAVGSWARLRLEDLGTGRLRGALLLVRPGTPDLWLALSPEGNYIGAPGVEKELVAVVQTAEGQQTLTLEEFAGKHGWKNEPQQVRLSGE